MYSAYLDRFTDNDKAILLVDSLKQDFQVPTESLPDGSEVGTWFLLDIQMDAIISIQIDNHKTNTMENEVQKRLERLQANKKSRFSRRS